MTIITKSNSLFPTCEYSSDTLYLTGAISLLIAASVFYREWAFGLGRNAAWALYGASVSLVLCASGSVVCKYASSIIVFLCLIVLSLPGVYVIIQLPVTFLVIGLVAQVDTRGIISLFYRLSRALWAGACAYAACQMIQPLMPNIDSFQFFEPRYILPAVTLCLVLLIRGLDYLWQSIKTAIPFMNHRKSDKNLCAPIAVLPPRALIPNRAQQVSYGLSLSILSFWMTMLVFEPLGPGAVTHPLALPILWSQLAIGAFLFCLPTLISAITHRHWLKITFLTLTAAAPIYLGYLARLLQQHGIGFRLGE